MNQENGQKLDVKDKKILYELDLNAHQTFSQIAKKVRLHKDTVAYRMKQLEKAGIISGYTTILSYPKVGLSIFKMYFQFQGMTKIQEEEILNYFVKHEGTGWIAACNGSWDLIVGFGVKDSTEFNKIKTEIMIKYSRFITNIAVTELIEAFIYPRNYLLNTENHKETRLIDDAKKEEVNPIDKKILLELTKNSRNTVVEIAQKLKTTARIVQYRIKHLEKNNTIKLYKLTLNLEKTSYQYYKCFITLHNLTKQREASLLEYCKQNPNIIHNVISLGAWDLEPEFEVKNAEEFYQIIKEMRNKFSDIIKSIETVVIQRELKFNYLP